MSTVSAQLKELIADRRTIKPEAFNGKQVPKDIVMDMLEAANWAPTHGMTEPWRFIVFSGKEGVQKFGQLHARIYQQETPSEHFLDKKYDTLLHKPDNASYVIVIVMKRGDNKNIPENEEMAATACAVQNMLLTAAAHGVAAYWGTGGMCYHPAMRNELGFGDQDRIMGFLFLGHTDAEHPKGNRTTPIEAKTTWR
ncbi:MAG: nitroreductase [Chitinophagales bacterium]